MRYGGNGRALRICLAAVLVVLLSTVIIARNVSQEDLDGVNDAPRMEDRSGWAIDDSEQAMARTLEIVGLADWRDLPVTAELVTLEHDNTPFLSDQIIWRPIWHVVIGDWKLPLDSAPPQMEDSYPRTFDMYIDPRNGQLLKIISRWPEGVPAIPPEPGADAFTERMVRSGNQIYHGFPENDPAISFLAALDGLLAGGENPLLVEQIIGQYVMWSRLGREPRPMWVITLRASRPLWDSAFPGAAVSARNHLRYTVDPQTGEWLTASSVPQPEGDAIEP